MCSGGPDKKQPCHSQETTALPRLPIHPPGLGHVAVLGMVSARPESCQLPFAGKVLGASSNTAMRQDGEEEEEALDSSPAWQPVLPGAAQVEVCGGKKRQKWGPAAPSHTSLWWEAPPPPDISREQSIPMQAGGRADGYHHPQPRKRGRPRWGRVDNPRHVAACHIPQHRSPCRAPAAASCYSSACCHCHCVPPPWKTLRRHCQRRSAPLTLLPICCAAVPRPRCDPTASRSPPRTTATLPSLATCGPADCVGCWARPLTPSGCHRKSR